VERRALEDLEYRAEFERQQFQLYEARRLAEETQASAVVAASFAVAALVLADYGRKGHPEFGWLLLALLALVWTVVLALVARFVSWRTPHLLGGEDYRPGTQRPSDVVDSSLDAVRQFSESDQLALRERVKDHWRARAYSAYALSKLKGSRLRWSLPGFVGPLVYFAVRLAS
jgi:hypothetical protein